MPPEPTPPVAQEKPQTEPTAHTQLNEEAKEALKLFMKLSVTDRKQMLALFQANIDAPTLTDQSGEEKNLGPS